VDSNPLRLMTGNEVLSANQDTARMTFDDLRSGLRSAGITHSETLSAGLLERTGNVAVTGQGVLIEAWMVANSRSVDRLSYDPPSDH